MGDFIIRWALTRAELILKSQRLNYQLNLQPNLQLNPQLNLLAQKIQMILLTEMLLIEETSNRRVLLFQGMKYRMTIGK